MIAVHSKIPSDAFFLFAAYAGYVRFFNFIFVSLLFHFYISDIGFSDISWALVIDLINSRRDIDTLKLYFTYAWTKLPLLLPHEPIRGSVLSCIMVYFIVTTYNEADNFVQ